MRKLKTALAITLCAGLCVSSVTGVSAKTMADPLLDKKNPDYQYQFDDVNVMKAWKLLKEKGYSKVKVGVIDTGVDTHHEDLKKNLKEYVRVSKGAVKKAVEDVDMHGTHVSGIIAATYNNGKGGAGIASGFDNDMVELYVASVQDDDGSINDVDLIKSIEYFKEKGVKVVNMSLGGYSYDDNIHKALRAAYDAGMVLIAASGNDDTNKDSSPAVYKEVISVNSSDYYNEPSYFSNYGISSDVSAPGSAVPSTIPGDRYVPFSGTSMASPVVAGVASLVLSANKDLTPSEVYNILCGSVNKSKMGSKFFDEKQYAYGIVDAYEAVKAAYEMKEHPSDKVDSIFVKSKTLTVPKGYEIAIETLISPYTSTANITWSSSDEKVATVDKDGYVKGIAVGHTTVTAKAGDKEVNVSVNISEDTAPTGIEILKAKKVISVGEMAVPTVKITPDDAFVTEYYATSSDKNVAVAYSNFGVRGIKPGKATITLRTVNGLEEKYEVTVKPAVYDIKITKKTDKLKVGKKFKFAAEALNSSGKTDVAKKGVEWAVTDTRFAKIDKKTGELTAKKAGKVFVKVTSKGLREDGTNNMSKIFKVELTGKAKEIPAKPANKAAKKSKNMVKASHIVNAEAMLKSKANDLIDTTCADFISNRTKYSKEVMDAVFKLKKEALKYILDAKYDTELYTASDDEEAVDGLVPTGKLAEYDMQFRALSGYDILKTGYKYNFSKLKNEIYNIIKEGYKVVDKKGLNEYYAQIVDAKYTKAMANIKKAKNVLELAKADAASMSLPSASDLELKGIRNVKDFEAVYTNNDIKVIKRLLKRQLDSYVNGALKMADYKKDVKGLKKDLKSYKKDIDKTLYVGEMFTKTDNYIKTMVKKTGTPYEKVSIGDMNKANAAVDKVMSGFDIKNYSTKGWDSVKNAYNDASDNINTAWYKGELYKIDTKLKSKLSKVKTLKEEKAAKAAKAAKASKKDNAPAKKTGK